MSTALFRSQWRTIGCQITSRNALTSPRIRWYSAPGPEPIKPARSPHAQFYSDLVPSMVPVALLGSAVYLGLRLYQSKLSHQKYYEETLEKISKLEGELDGLQLQLQQSSSGNVEVSRSRWWWF